MGTYVRVAVPGKGGAWRVAASVILCCLWAAPLRAQILSGRVVEEGAGTPVQGALVELIRADSSRVTAVLSRPDGRYAIRLPIGEQVRLRVIRIGYATWVSEPMGARAAARGPLDVDLRVEAVALDPLVATGEGRCQVDPRRGEETARLWVQARKALEVTALIHREGLLRLEAARYERWLDPERTSVYEERLRQGDLDRPFRSLPADSLSRGGFVQPEGDGFVYYMPDPEVALSDVFLDGHCFGVVGRQGPDGPWVGLAFQPVSGASLPDVTGTLWLHAASGELRSLEYHYVNLDPEEAEEVARGRADFELLPNGAWVVRRWLISMPLMERRSRIFGLFHHAEVTGIREEGGEVIQAYSDAGEPLTRPGGGRLEGRVVDGDSGEPLAGAVVHLSGTPRVTTSAADGSFAFEGLYPGAYLVTFTHALLDTLGAYPAAEDARVPLESDSLRVFSPPRVDVWRRVCSGVRPTSRTGTLSGRVFDAQGEPLDGVEVELLINIGGREAPARATTDARGRYRFCGVPAGVEHSVAAHVEGVSSQPVTFSVEPRAFRLVDFRVGSGRH